MAKEIAIKKTKLDEIKEKSKKYLLGNYSPYDVSFKYGVGELLFDTENKQYIDFLSGVAVMNLGHSDADIVNAIREQADRLFQTSNWFYSEESSNLAEAIIENSFPGKVFFCNSGTEANEAAFKLARKNAFDRGIEKPVMLSLKESFHGRTLSSMMMTGQEKVRTGFGELLSGFDYLNANDEDALVEKFEKHQGKVAALVLEPIIGEGGIIPLTQSFMNLARKLTEETNSILIFDEIQTGMGRTGRLFCCEHYGIIPDVMTLGKALASGFPIGAMVVTEEYSNVLGAGTHGSTFGGNHLATFVAYETIKIIFGREILDNVNGISEFLFNRLRMIQNKFSIIKEIRGKGLHIGVDFRIPTKNIAIECLKEGLVVNSTAETVIRLMPPLNIGIERVDEAMNIFEKVLERFNQWKK